MNFYQLLAQQVDQWRSRRYTPPDDAAIAEIFDGAGNPEGPGFRLRPPQVRALETFLLINAYPARRMV